VTGVSGKCRSYTLCGNSPDAYNDVGGERVCIESDRIAVMRVDDDLAVILPPHSVSVLQIDAGCCAP
ncbi:MAG: hypothetical protein Q4D04_02555, partial [Clostridia bacterium]|nr:hypothetical protein [Clostridia bacterium]